MNKHYTLIFTTISLIFVSFSSLFAQIVGVETTKFPQNYHFFARDLTTNKAISTAEGTVLKTANLKAMRLRVLNGQTAVQDVTQPIDTNATIATFKISFEIPAGLTNYSVELQGVQKNNASVWHKQANLIVAGDVFIINGQSNALGWIEGDNLGDRDTFMRVFLEQGGWREAFGTSVGKWGSRFLKNIIEKEKIPVAVFNEAYGGQQIDYFMRRPDSPYTARNNYADLYKRLKVNNLEKSARALIWWQGESDGWAATPDSFRAKTKRLFQHWREDYGNVPVFYHQIRPRACGHLYPYIAEAQRQMVTELPNSEIVSTNPARISDGCHFTYFNGYDSLGNRLYRIVANKLYGKNASFVRPPNIVSAVLLPNKDIEISFANMPTGNLRSGGSFWQDFRLDGTTNAQITGATATANKIVLKLSGDTTGIRGVSYLCNLDTLGGENRFVVNPQNIGILQFYNFPVTLRSATGLTQIADKSFDFDLYPTVANMSLTISFNEKLEKKARIFVVNALGQTVLNVPITEGGVLTDLKTDFLPNGVYFVQIEVENKVIGKAKKFVISR